MTAGWQALADRVAELVAAAGAGGPRFPERLAEIWSRIRPEAKIATLAGPPRARPGKSRSHVLTL